MEYFGSLTDNEINYLVNKIDDDKLITKISTKFYQPESIDEAKLQNKFIQTIKIHH